MLTGEKVRRTFAGNGPRLPRRSPEPLTPPLPLRTGERSAGLGRFTHHSSRDTSFYTAVSFSFVTDRWSRTRSM